MESLSIYCDSNLLYNQEDMSKYCPGGFHPVCLGDTFKDGRYKIHHKLDWGGVSTLRIRPSGTDREENDGMEPYTESDSSERGDDGDHTIPAQDDRKRMGYIHTAGRAGIMSLTNGNSCRTDAAVVVGGIQQSTVDDSGTNALQTALP